MVISEELIKKAETCVFHLKNAEKKITFAESCTGGLLSFLISSIPGASDVFECSLVTYSNSAKVSLLGIEKEMLSMHGAVSSKTAMAMAKSLIDFVHDAEIAISITGYAGERTKNEDIVANAHNTGTVFVGCAQRNTEPFAREFQFGTHLMRREIQQKAAESALDIILQQPWRK